MARQRKLSCSRRPARCNVIALLGREHEEIRAILDRLARSSDEAPALRGEIVAELAARVRVHSAVEEEVFDPAFLGVSQSHADATIFFEANEDHHLLAVMLLDLERTEAGSPDFDAKARAFTEALELHMEAEEREMFPRAAALFSANELEVLAVRCAAREAGLEAEVGSPR
jgi:hemerythrin-like domain-containing protein